MATVVPRSYHFQMNYAQLSKQYNFRRWYDFTGNVSESKHADYKNSYAFSSLPRHLQRVKKKINRPDELWASYKWLTVPEVCEFLSISKSTFYKWRMLGTAPIAKRLPNGDLRIRQDWLNNFMSELPEEI